MVLWYVWVAIQIALFVLAELLRPKPKLENAKPASLGDFQFPTTTEDRVIPLLWGTAKQKGPNVVWYGDFIQDPITKKIKTGLFSSKEQITGFRYYLGIQFALCRGEVDVLRKVWIGDVLVWSYDSIVGVEVAGGGTGYAKNQILTISGGTFTEQAQVRVLDTNIITGAVTSVRLVRKGEYTVFPFTTAATTGGTGSGCTLTLTKGAEIEHGDELTIDCPNLFGGDDLGRGGVRGTLTFFAGTDTQTASPYLSSHAAASIASIVAGGTGYAVGNILTVSGGTFSSAAQILVTSVGGSGEVSTASLIYAGFYSVFPSGTLSTTGGAGSGCTVTLTAGAGFQDVGGVTPRYLRTAYLIPSEDPIYLGNDTSISPWSFELRRIPDPLGLGAHATINDGDANPANVLVEILENSEWGLRQATARVDSSSFADAGEILYDEGNGFSMIVDREIEASELVRLIEEQIEGVVFFNQLTSKWQINLVRGGYDVDSLPLLSTANILEVENFARGAWEDTTNQVSVKFTDRADDYKQTSALAQDQANIDVLQGRVVPASPDYPGVKDRDLANSIAWRDLRGLSYPLAKAVLIVDRTLYDTQPGNVVAWTYEIGGESFVKMPMRVAEVDYGQLENGRIRLSLVEDVFETAVGSFSAPGDTHWEPQVDTLAPFDYELAFEAPRAFTLRDTDGGGPYQDKIWAAARRKGSEVGFSILERHAAGTPTGGYTEVGQVYALTLVGNLQSALSRGSAVPLTSLTVAPGPDSQTALESAFSDVTDVTDIGTNLVNLILVGSEFMLPTSAQTSGANVQLNGVYRGVLDSVQGSHAAGTPVYLVHVGGGLSSTTLPAGDNVDVKLLPFSLTGALAEDAADTISIAMANRVRSPYPPSRLSLDGTAWKSSTSLEDNGAGPETYAIDLSSIRRRDYRTVDEVQAIEADAATIFTDFPTANSTTHKVSVYNDPAGANTILFTTADFSGTQQDVLRLEILKANAGVLPTSLRFDIYATHSHESVTYDSVVPLRHDFSVTSALTGQFAFGALDNGDVSNVYTADAAGTHSFTLSSAFSAGDVEYRVNGGSWTTLISAGGTSGNIGGVSVSDTIEVRHLSTDTTVTKQLDMAAPGAGTDAFAVLYT